MLNGDQYDQILSPAYLNMKASPPVEVLSRGVRGGQGLQEEQILILWEPMG